MASPGVRRSFRPRVYRRVWARASEKGAPRKRVGRTKTLLVLTIDGARGAWEPEAECLVFGCSSLASSWSSLPRSFSQRVVTTPARRAP
ncbi:hypothetical protein DB32_004911 [Sandaracinus amylolyticus]|uniref:Uncharacterized protein n=1 Tax=Sandaracinus amylolyticus TaxID=927083 RepID=A0A0F6W563_9BACT|nr:hypothetical protein DB32_004911 [Sandaracinus amylolyticus]